MKIRIAERRRSLELRESKNWDSRESRTEREKIGIAQCEREIDANIDAKTGMAVTSGSEQYKLGSGVVKTSL